MLLTSKSIGRGQSLSFVEEFFTFHFQKRVSSSNVNNLKMEIDRVCQERFNAGLGRELSVINPDEKVILEVLIDVYKNLGYKDSYLTESAKLRIYQVIAFSDVFSMKQGAKLFRSLNNKEKLNYEVYGGYFLAYTPSYNLEVTNCVDSRKLAGVFPLVTPEIYNPILSAFFADYELDAVTREKFLDAYLHLEDQDV